MSATPETVIEMLYVLAICFYQETAGCNSPSLNGVTRRAHKPQPGDLVVETTHLRGREPIARTMGVLLETAIEAGEVVHYIHALDGMHVRWENAMFCALPVTWKTPTISRDDHLTEVDYMEARANGLFGKRVRAPRRLYSFIRDAVHTVRPPHPARKARAEGGGE